MFGRDPIVPLNSFLMPTIIYLSTDDDPFPRSFEKYVPALVSNLEHARKKRDTKASAMDRKLKVGDSVLLKDHTTGVWDPRYTEDY